MGSSSDESIDWIREFKTPDRSVVSLSSDTSPESTPKLAHFRHSEVKRLNKKEDIALIDSGEDSPIPKHRKPKTPKKKNLVPREEILGATEDGHEDSKVKLSGPLVSSRLPLVFPDKIQRSKALVECEGDSIDLSGDVGAVGRIIISNGSSGKPELLLDLKGTIYKSTIVPSRTLLVLANQKQREADCQIEAIMNDFIRLEPQSNMFEAETMIEGTLDGFSFDSDEDGEKVKVFAQQGDPNNETEIQKNKRSRGKAEKKMGTPNKKNKTSGKTPKKAARKSQVAKRNKKSKK